MKLSVSVDREELLQYVRGLEDDWDEKPGVPVDALENCVANKFCNGRLSEARRALEECHITGHIFEPKLGYFRVT